MTSPTCFAITSGVSGHALTGVPICTIRTRSSILTRVARAFINVYKYLSRVFIQYSFDLVWRVLIGRTVFAVVSTEAFVADASQFIIADSVSAAVDARTVARKH